MEIYICVAFRLGGCQRGSIECKEDRNKRNENSSKGMSVVSEGGEQREELNCTCC